MNLKERKASIWEGLEEEGEREMSKLNYKFKVFFNLTTEYRASN